MSFDPQQTTLPNYQDVQPQTSSSGKKWWIIGGCGCLTVILLCCGGFGAAYYYIYSPFQQFLNEQIGLAESSGRVAELLGNNAQVDQSSLEDMKSTQQEGAVLMEYQFPIHGDDASGILIISGTWESFKIEAESLKLKIGDEIYDLNVEDEFELDIDDGF